MASYRDQVRTKQAQQASRARQQGINVDDVRKESRGLQATGAMVSRLVNESTPTQGHERIYADDFVGQTFNGTNNEFTVSRRVLGQNILMWRVDQASGTLIPLVRTTNPAPAGEQFFFDGFFTVRVGVNPQVLDGLLASYVTSL